MSKKQWWTKKDRTLFPNSVKKHEKEIEYFPEEDYSDYSWNLDRKLINNEEKSESIESPWSDYSSGKSAWRGYGYYRQPQLSYKYVQQMANALAAEYRIKVKVGINWTVDLINKELTYNPASLIYGTKGELLATLMHEIGRLCYVTFPQNLKKDSVYLTQYYPGATEVLGVFEDIRVDYQMLKRYPGAGEIYESAIPGVEAQIEKIHKKDVIFRDSIQSRMKDLLYRIRMEHSLKGRPDPDMDISERNNPEFISELVKYFGEMSYDSIKTRINAIDVFYRNNGSLFNYCGRMLEQMYDIDKNIVYEFSNIKSISGITQGAVEPSKKSLTTKELISILDKDVYPYVEGLMKDLTGENQQLKDNFPNMPQNVKDSIIENIVYNLKADSSLGGIGVGNTGIQQARSSGPSNNIIPPEWQTGDYKTLKDSVSMEIKSLTQKLMFLRREEMTIKYQADQKRGKLNSKKLYKSSTGNRRLFKKKMDNIDTIRSFAFSLILDVSGSMNGLRITHMTRGLIILCEVFQKLEIPFEIITFDDGVKTVKDFNEDFNKNIQRDIGGLVNNHGGGTNLDRGLKETKIKNQPEKNKIVVVLTDGGVGKAEDFDEEFFKPWAKEGITSVGFGVECEDEMANLCLGNSRLLDSASELPVEFSNLLKTLIKRK